MSILQRPAGQLHNCHAALSMWTGVLQASPSSLPTTPFSAAKVLLLLFK